jgi:hypothetical protein
LTNDNISTAFANKGIITTSWSNPIGKTFNKEETIFNLVFTAKTNGKLTHNLSLSSELTKAEAYNIDLEVMDIKLTTRSLPHSNEISVKQNTPNPFEDNTTVEFTLPAKSIVSIKVLDVTGKQVYQTNGEFEKGQNTIVLSSSDLKASGVLYLQFEAGDFKTVSKMIHIKP